MPEPMVLVAREGAVATVTLNRPEALNALNRELTLALRDAVFCVGERQQPCAAWCCAAASISWRAAT